MTPETLAPLAVAIPLIAGAAIAVFGSVLPARAVSLLSIAATAGATAVCAILLARSWQGFVIHWFGGWHPSSGIALGIDFAVGPYNAAIATFVSALVLASLVFADGYYERSGPSFYVLMNVFHGAMAGFALTGDIFNLFVFFELMSVTAYAMTAFRIEDPSAVEGAFNFAITNSIGAFLVLIGIALLYGRTGALNFAQLGHAIAVVGKPDALLIVVFALLASGFMVKGALFPFHLWLDDAHAVAPTPLCVLFSGIMVQLGLYAVVRIYWSVFSGAFHAEEPALRATIVGFGAAGALVGSMMCFVQPHLKRLLAFSTIGHSGLLLTGFGLFSAKALAGFWLYVFGHGLIKGALFMCSGILLNRFDSANLNELRGKARDLPLTALVLAVGAVGLAGLPPFGTYLGKSLMEEASREHGFSWLPWLYLLVGALTGGGVLRATGRVYFGWGPRDDAGSESGGETPKRESPEAGSGEPRRPWRMAIPAAVLLLISLGLGTSMLVAGGAEQAAKLFHNRIGYEAAVLAGSHIAPPPFERPFRGLSGLLFGIGGAVGAVLLAALALFAERIPDALRKLASAIFGPPLALLRAMHNGAVTDYVIWITVGTVIFGGLIIGATR